MALLTLERAVKKKKKKLLLLLLLSVCVEGRRGGAGEAGQRGDGAGKAGRSAQQNKTKKRHCGGLSFSTVSKTRMFSCFGQMSKIFKRIKTFLRLL